MGTRCLTKVYDEDTEILCLYRQFDGYPKGGHGDELTAFLSGMKITNGIRVGADSTGSTTTVRVTVRGKIVHEEKVTQ
jgi:hypothetical protein